MATFVLVPGFWLGAWAWRDVTAALRSLGHDVYPMTLTGVAERDHLAGPEVGLDTHTTDIVRLIEVEDLWEVLLVGHSGGGMPVAQAADRIPDRIARVVYVESGPLPDGFGQFDTVPPEEQARLRAAIGDGHLLPPPAFDPAADPTNLAGLDEPMLALLRARATPQPLRAATDLVRRTGGRPVPTALVASTFPLAVVRQMIGEGHPFFTGLADGQLFELRTGHWPMLSEPKALVDVLDAAARG
ncbi:alpha/beta fold hydrolase [Micromonospora orduensis]|uniref:Alpha/beta fold hydrolase n=1 Tax=Micromonospora orduensis TaxID=1420891 RepID=A0A5C4R013_9ACTN|nr:alpha/beta fold hydrolase [Micromonospora orduensis]TNH31587.1 alpha/beta fold hydrolase [Micromonospora orduensis]